MKNENAAGADVSRSRKQCFGRIRLKRFFVSGPSSSRPVAHHRNRFQPRHLFYAIEQETVKDVLAKVIRRSDGENKGDPYALR